MLLGAIDLACKRLPHLLVLPAIGLSALGFSVVAAVTGRVVGAACARSARPGRRPWSTACSTSCRAGRSAQGDVTLGALLGGYLGWLGWPYVSWGALLPWLVNLPVLVVALLSGRLGPRSTVPFGPAMLTGAILAVLVGGWLDRTG